jgi:hypothetical protein
VVLVDDVVAGPEVGERLQGAAEAGARPRRALAEDLRVGKKDEPEVPPDESAACRRDGKEEARLVGKCPSLLEPLDLEPPEEVGRAEPVAAVRKRDDDTLAGADERGELLLGLGQPARGDGGALRLEGEGLASRERVEARGAP